MKSRSYVHVSVAIALILGSSNPLQAQRAIKKAARTTPPKFQSDEFNGVFFSDPLAHLSGTPPSAQALATNTNSDMGAELSNSEALATGNEVWKSLISATTIEDLVKESKARVDAVITTPAKFAGGGYSVSRREFTLLASMMGIIAQYPEEIRWKASSGVAQALFAKAAANSKVGTAGVFEEVKKRQADLQSILKGTKLEGTAEETTWEATADNGPLMQLLEWALREHLSPSTNSEASFREGQEDIVRYAELAAALGQILQQEGMSNADDSTYNQFAAALVQAARDTAKAAKNNDPELARIAVGQIDQACNKCHAAYR